MKKFLLLLAAILLSFSSTSAIEKVRDWIKGEGKCDASCGIDYCASEADCGGRPCDTVTRTYVPD
jgi:hypothetical protein